MQAELVMAVEGVLAVIVSCFEAPDESTHHARVVDVLSWADTAHAVAGLAFVLHMRADGELPVAPASWFFIVGSLKRSVVAAPAVHCALLVAAATEP